MRGLLRFNTRSQAGFTMVELLVVMALFATLITLTTVTLVRPQASASITKTANALVADIKAQQLRAMAGDSDSASSAQPYGIYVQGGQYTMFKGSAYSGADSDNFVIGAGSGITLSTTFASTQVVFAKGTGEVNSFNGSANTITVSSATSGQTKTITINRYGVVTVSP
jgi:prepilin-type N-terminal cleavage/methylation domain-containing protein